MKAIALQAIHLPNGSVLGHEVLAREAEGNSWVGPGAFMKGCDAHSWIDLDHAVAELLVEHSKMLNGRGVAFVNLSAHTLEETAALEFVCKTLTKAVRSGIKVCIEVSETFNAEGLALLQSLDLIRGHGLLLAVDDYGKDWSDFSRLTSYPWDFCKVDLPAVWDSSNFDWVIEVRDYCAVNNIGLILEKLESTQLLNGLLKPLSAAAVQGFAVSMPFILQAESLAERASLSKAES
ncbi:EAL domain-containing protein [Pseudomonas sp. Irchel 3E13]|uniref:EAL domain-containing protein n=1 Tax=Pseudomonas sp. Irchel 3E13 TaxID=2008975 RepID=UPI000BA35831|nr:EAL domain-containing protein [Pseudomonas sp. Irchel 3E13]